MIEGVNVHTRGVSEEDLEQFGGSDLLAWHVLDAQGDELNVWLEVNQEAVPEPLVYDEQIPGHARAHLDGLHRDHPGAVLYAAPVLLRDHDARDRRQTARAFAGTDYEVDVADTTQDPPRVRKLPAGPTFETPY